MPRVVGCAAALFGIVLATAAPLHAAELKLAHDLPQSHPLHTEILVPYAQRVAVATHGNVVITVLSGGGFSDPASMVLARLFDRRVDLAVGPADSDSQHVTATSFLGAPALAGDAATLVRRAWGLVDGPLAADFKHVVLVALWSADPLVLMSHGSPVRRVEDLRNARIGVSSPFQMALMKEFGAAPTLIDKSAMADALLSGRVVTVLAPASAIDGYGLAPAIRFVTVGLLLGRPPFALVMNADSARTLRPSDREAIKTAGGLALGLRAAAMYREAGEDGLGFIRRSPKHQLIRLATMEAERGAQQARAALDRIARRAEAEGIAADTILHALAGRKGAREAAGPRPDLSIR